MGIKQTGETMKKHISILVVLAVISLIIGCQQAKEQPSAPETAAESINSISSGVSDIDALDKELDISELDTLDDELAEIEDI